MTNSSQSGRNSARFAEEDCASENKEVHPMLKDILTLMLAIVLSFTTGGSVQDEK